MNDSLRSELKRRGFREGAIVRHFKHKYYIIVCFATHTETGDPLVIYRALYGEHKVCARPIEMFLSKVDKEKYPDAKQKYRFEACNV